MEALNPLVYYTTDARRAKLPELFRMSPPGPFGKLSVILVKLLQLPSPVHMGMALCNAHQCSFSEIPELFQRFDKEVDALGEMGFRPVVALRMPITSAGSCCSLAMLGEDPTVYANIVFSSAAVGGREYGESGVSFVSREESEVWATSSMAHMLDGPACVRALYCPGFPVERLHKTHFQRLSAVPPSALRHFSPETLWSDLLEMEAMVTDFNIARGVFRPLTASEVASLSGN